MADKREEDRDVFGDTLPAEIRLPTAPEADKDDVEGHGVHITKKTFNRYVMKGAAELKSMLGEIYREECRRVGYFMIDETVMTVGVDDAELGRRYLNRYMWEFYNSTANLMEYVYEEGSRGQKVLKAFFGDGLELLKMVISCDTYNAYRLFDSEEYPGITVVSCWSQARRNFVDALESCRP